MKQYDVGVCIMRAQPFHNGHLHLIEQAMLNTKKVIILLGSANKASNIKNPFSFDERAKMICDTLTHLDGVSGRQDTPEAWINRASVLPLKDFTYNDELWAQHVQYIVGENVQPDDKITLIGHTKDESTYYLKMFPQWEYTEVGHNDKLNATDIRELLYDQKTVKYLQGVVPTSVYNYIDNKLATGDLNHLIEEYEFVEKYKKSWAAAPYAPTFITADSVVIQQGHVLAIRRGANPGKNLLALPGGFVNQNEFVKDAAIRELREETKLKVPDPVLRGSIVAEKMFDAPNRSLRGRTITIAYLIHLTNVENGLPKVKGSDDAKSAEWIPLGDLKEEDWFEDHFHLIHTMTGLL
jgi:bifunctional NMN adenylyltransferase/nudix hydrolase